VHFNAPKRFHEKCDNKGATIMFIKTNNGCIFGGYNPVSWLSDFCYSATDYAYLFSVTDGKGRQPVKCPVRRHKKKFAIKQNEGQYSPAFGEANISDLFIAFKNLQNSYSMLGNVYKLPQGIDVKDAESFLAGRKKDWVVDEVEVWAVSHL
jgi:hypothetical protein